MSRELKESIAPVREEDVQGLKYFRRLWPLLERLRGVGCEWDRAGNRMLTVDPHCGLVLLFLSRVRN